MKKLYKTILSLCFGLGLVSNVNAQVFPESFEGTSFPPTGWVKFDNGIGTTQSWTTTATAQSGSKAAFVRYELATTAEDWLVTPAVLISAATPSLTYWDREQYTTVYNSEYSVLVSTSSQTDVATFSVVSTYTETTVAPTTYAKKTVDLSAYAGQSIYIAFRMTNDDGDNWLLDNINMVGPCVTPPLAGTISGAASVTNGTVNNYTIAPSSGNIQWYTSASVTGPWNAIANATTAVSQPISAVGSGTMFLTVIASNGACPNDTANVPFQVDVVFPNATCDAIMLPLGSSNTVYDLFGASAETGEVTPQGTGCSTNNSWCSTNTINNSRWFSFVAPASGNVTVQSPGFDTQLAVWKAASCADLIGQATPTAPTTATLIAANDDDTDYTLHGGVSFSSFVKAGCLAPGAIYYIQLDSYSAATAGNTTKVLVMDAGVFSAVASATDATCGTCPDGVGNVVAVGGFSPYTYLWSDAFASTSSTVYSLTPGCYSVTITDMLACQTTQTVCVGFATGLQSLTKTTGISIFPNPTNGLVTVEVSTALVNATFEVYDALGKLVVKESLIKNNSAVDISKLQEGVYLFKLLNDKSVVKTGKLIKQ